MNVAIKTNTWNKFQPETTQKCFKKAGFVTTQEQNVAALLVSLLPMAEFEGVDFEDIVATDDNVAVCNEPDLEAIFQSVLTKVQPSGKVLEATDEAEELSEN
ncbi:uncharacterized protein M6D78_001261 [Vipera latastei]